jgi:predicted nucleic acid-binding protein
LVAEAARAYVTEPLGGFRTVLAQRREICLSARNIQDFNSIAVWLDEMPLLPDATPEVSAASEQLQRALVRRGTHRGPKVIDLIIAATALVHGCEVLHYDSDFDLLADAEPALRARWIVPRGSVA